MRDKRNRRQRGFTMIELLVASTIIAVLTAVGLVSYTSANQNARNGKRRADLEQVRAALELYRTENGLYPNTSSWTTMMNNLSGFVTTPNIEDPKNSGNYVYTYTPGGSARTYEICANLEPDETDFCLQNP